MTSTIFEQVRDIASDLFGVSPDIITSETSPASIESWDSPQHLNFILAIEEKFHFQLSPEEMEEMHDIGEIVKIVQRRVLDKKGNPSPKS